MKRIACSMLLLLACHSTTEKNATYALTVQVRTDVGEPVTGALIAVGETQSERTRQDGDAILLLTGREGQRVRVHVECPDTYRPHAGAIDTALRTLGAVDGGGRRAALVETTCLPAVRAGVLIVRTRGAGSVPIWIDGEVVGRTGENEVAHIPLTLVPGASLRVTLDTSATPRLRPASPTHRFVVEDRDGLLLLDQEFKVAAHRARRPSAPSRDVPYRLESGASLRSSLRIN